MKSLIKKLGIFLLIFMSVSLSAQEFQRSYFPPRDAGWWTLGINGGWAYQQSDVPSTLDGYGFGMTLAKNMYYRPGGAISFDWRGRWLYSQTIGLDTKRAFGLENNDALNGTREAGEGLDYTAPTGPGYVFQNNKTHQFELGLEGVITANRLRERTGVIASLYGGINLDWYGAKIDQADNNGIYDYTLIDQNDSKSAVKNNLKNLRDGVYETNAPGNEEGAGKIKFMPSLGLELGYQLTPRFSMHAGHKITFARTDDLDGELWLDDNNPTAANDIHHYTNLGLQWIIDPAQNRMDPPIINVTFPGTNPYISPTSAGRVDAKIKNVRNRTDITCSVNGRPSSFSFNRGKFRLNCPLEYGENQVVITAVNEVGSDEETVIIFYGDNSTPPVFGDDYAPRVRITNPNNSPHTSEYQNFTVKADINYIRNKNDIEFLINGRKIYDFNYDVRNNKFSANVQLNEGRNEVEIIARNEVGSDRDNAVIFYDKKIENPRVRITSPSRTPYETTQRNFTVKATLDNVPRKNNVRFYVNGREKSLFNYNDRTGTFTADLVLENGRNDVIVKGSNDAGEAQDEATIIYKNNTPVARPPIVEITTPSNTNSETTQRNATIRARLQYVDRKNDVRFFVNGREKTLFNYNQQTGQFSADLTLENGRNDIEVKGYNQHGNAQDQVTIIYKTTSPPTGQAPSVTITSVSSGTANPMDPNPNPCRTTIIAEVLRVTRKSDITFKLNGQTRTDFTFNANTKEFRSTVTLKDGSNNISIRAVNPYGNDQDTASKNCQSVTTSTTQPPEITINKPVNNSTTNNSVTNLNARLKYVTRKNDIRVKLNGNNVSNFSFSPVSKVVTAQLNLKSGNNTITVWAKNDDGTDEESVRVIYNAPSSPPDVVITKPTDNSSTTNATAGLAATTKNVTRKNDVQIKLNGNTVSNFSFSAEKVTAQLTLKEGWNTISVLGKNNDGEDEASIRVKYNAPKNPPTVSITQPTNNATTDTKTAVVKAKVLNVSGKGDIRFTFNGNNFNNFSYSNSSKILTANVTLKEGANTISIKATTADGSDSKTVRVKYQVPKVMPSVKITSPKNNYSTENKTVAIKANLQNVLTKNDVTFLVNGKKVTAFNYQRRTFNANINLKEGNNIIRIEAQNKDGNAADQITVKYKPKVVVIEKPVIKFTTPKRSGTTAKKKKTSAKASVTNVQRKDQIKVTLNGRSTSFTFDNRRREVTIPLNLKNGNNKIGIVATNNGGSTAAETILKFKDRPVSNIIKPTITITSVSTPTANPFNPGVSGSTILATVQSISKKDQVTVTHNGKAVTDFTFNSRTNQLKINIQLDSGTANKVSIKATNTAGSTVKDHTY